MIEVPYLSYERLKELAENVLEQSSYSDSFPVDIEMIVEDDFEMDIIPIRGLKTSYDIDAFISKDLQTITVDETVLESRRNRYRFSLAHELGHRVLHEDILSSIDFETTAQWKECINSIPTREYGFLEYQANTFANAILIPSSQLHSRFADAIEQIRAAGMDPKQQADTCLDYVATGLGKQFCVSAEAMTIRIEKEAMFDAL